MEDEVHPYWQTAPAEEKTEEGEVITESTEVNTEVNTDVNAEANSDEAGLTGETETATVGMSSKEKRDRLRKDETMRKRNWRISKEETERFRTIMKGYLGTQ